MDKRAVREEFEALVGEQSLKKFVLTLHGKSYSKARLLHWQEEMWKPFAIARGYPVTDFEEIRSLFLYCPIHAQEFDRENVPVIYGTFVQLSGEAEEFPFANEFVPGICWGTEEKTENVYYCPECPPSQNTCRLQ